MRPCILSENAPQCALSLVAGIFLVPFPKTQGEKLKIFGKLEGYSGPILNVPEVLEIKFEKKLKTEVFK